jgi:predicted  nucleic acid-binding Zn-ribbon protein
VAGGPLLTRDELRVCLKQEETIRNRITELETQREPLAAEKASIGVEQQAVRDERAKIEEFRKVADELGVRFKTYGTRVEALNARVAEFNASKRSGAPAERQRVEMNTEQAALVTERAVLEAERLRLSTQSEEIIRTYNTNVNALELRVTDWNERNAKWADRSSAVESDRKGWLSSCSDRRYREDDETAIRKGK